MITLELTNEEVRALYELVSRQRGRNSLLKTLHDIDTLEYSSELTSLMEKLTVIKDQQ